MQIKDLGKNRANMGGISDAVGKAKLKGQGEAVWRNGKSKVLEESFHDSLQKSMNAEITAEANIGAGNTAVGSNENEWYPDSTGRPGSVIISHADTGFGKNIAEGIGIRIEQNGEVYPAKEAEVRRLSYGECDKVEINVLEGYTLKAKMEAKVGEGDIGGYRVYVEMKDEDGMIKACLFDGAKLRKDSCSAMERIAYALMHDGEDI